jgi:hypothetical protein
VIRLVYTYTLPRRAHGPLQEHEHWFPTRSSAYRAVELLEVMHAGLGGKRWYWCVYDGTNPPHVRNNRY